MLKKLCCYNRICLCNLLVAFVCSKNNGCRCRCWKVKKLYASSHSFYWYCAVSKAFNAEEDSAIILTVESVISNRLFEFI
ncbi:hypothetical protein M5689_022642 [Euphorbia peplus]|nr:hypothetical protein M5689_022642 [Euphorbia peplus]